MRKKRNLKIIFTKIRTKGKNHDLVNYISDSEKYREGKLKQEPKKIKKGVKKSLK
jgi:hypothetical protein